MGLFDHLFKSKSPAGEEKVIEPALEGSAPGKSGEGAPKTPTPQRADPSAFLHPKSHVPRGAQGLTPAPTPGSRPASASGIKSPERRPATVVTAPAADEIVLTLGDVLSRIPSPYLKPGTHDAKRELRFKITDLSSDIGRGRAAVPLSRIAQLAPDIFVKEINRDEDTEVRLPLQKLVEQIGLLRSRPGATPLSEKVVRSISGAEMPASVKPIVPVEAKVIFPPKALAPEPAPAAAAPAPFVPATETLGPMPTPTPPTRPPIILGETATSGNAFELKPMVEQPAAAGVILGPSAVVEPPPAKPVEAKTEPIEVEVIPPAAPVVRVEAEAAAVAEVIAPSEVFPPLPKQAETSVLESAKPSAEVPAPPVEATATPVAPAPEPATPLPPASEEPQKIVIDWQAQEPASVEPEPVEAHTEKEAEPEEITIEPAVLEPAAQGTKLAPLESPDLDPGEEKIHLSLAAILKHCPPEIVVGTMPHVDDSVRITLPFAPIDRQLVKGHVEISALRFIVAMPEVYQKYFVAKVGVKVPIPLEEVFQNLPSPKHELVPSPPVPPPLILAPAVLAPPVSDAPPSATPHEGEVEVVPEEVSATAAAAQEEKPSEAVTPVTSEESGRVTVPVEPPPLTSLVSADALGEEPAPAPEPSTHEPVAPLFSNVPPAPPILTPAPTEHLATDLSDSTSATETEAAPAAAEKAEEAPHLAEPPPLPAPAPAADEESVQAAAFVPPWISMPAAIATPTTEPSREELEIAPVAPPPAAASEVPVSAEASESPVAGMALPIEPPPLPIFAATQDISPALVETSASPEAPPAMEPVAGSESVAAAEEPAPALELPATVEASAPAEPPTVLEPVAAVESPAAAEPAPTAEPPKVVFQRPLFRPQFIPPPPIFGFATPSAAPETPSEPEVKPEPPSLLAGLTPPPAPTSSPASEHQPLPVDLGADAIEAKSDPIDGAASPEEFDAPAAEAQTFASVSPAISEAPSAPPVLEERSDAEPSADLIASAGEHSAPDIVPFQTEPVPFADLAEELAHETTYASELAEIVHIGLPETETAQSTAASAKPAAEEPEPVPMAEGLAVAAVAATISEHVPLDLHEILAPSAETPESAATPGSSAESVAAENEAQSAAVEAATAGEASPVVEPSQVDAPNVEPSVVEPVAGFEQKEEKEESAPEPVVAAEAIALEATAIEEVPAATEPPAPEPVASVSAEIPSITALPPKAAPEPPAAEIPEPAPVPPPPIHPLFPIPKVPAEPAHLEVLPPPALPLRRFDQDAVQALFMTEETLDLPKISRLAAGLPGVYACVIATRDQACTGGTLPEGFDLAALLGLAPRVGEAAGRMPIGQLKHFTLYGDAYSVSFFERNGLSICAVHRPRSFVPGVREKLVALADELSR